MKYIITESQFKLLSELERHWMDFEHQEQYDRLKDKMVPYIINMIDSYDEEYDKIDLYDSNNEIIISFIPHKDGGGSLYYNKHLDDRLNKLFPHPIWLIHGKYIMSDVFNHFYPNYNVKSSRSSYSL